MTYFDDAAWRRLDEPRHSPRGRSADRAAVMMRGNRWLAAGTTVLAVAVSLVAFATAAPAARSRPLAEILAPREGVRFVPGDTLLMLANQAGAGATATSLSYRWVVDVHEGDRTLLSFAMPGARAGFVPGADSLVAGLSYDVRLIVTDAVGGADTALVRVLPPPFAKREHIIGAGDMLDVVVYAGGEKQEALNAQVSPSGFITSPLLGEMQVAGRTATELAQSTQRRLAEQYFVNPQVIVSVTASVAAGRVYVLGEVTRPGAYPLEEGMTVLKACTLAGGFTTFAALNSVRVLRAAPSGRRTITVDLVKVRRGKTDDVYLQAGDQVDVPHRRF